MVWIKFNTVWKRKFFKELLIKKYFLFNSTIIPKKLKFSNLKFESNSIKLDSNLTKFDSNPVKFELWLQKIWNSNLKLESSLEEFDSNLKK